MRLKGAFHCAFRQIGPSNRRAHANTSKIPAFDMLAVESCVYLVLGDASRAGCGGKLPRIAHSQKRGPRIGEYAPWPSNIGMVALSTVIVCA